NRPKVKTVGFPEIAKGLIDIAGVKAEAAADPEAGAVRLRAELPAGVTTLKAWFADAGGKGLCGAFFVTVRRED
ncbi:MAG: hypothetical protein ACRC33_12715, partial [Gemmataceae bacterium]